MEDFGVFRDYSFIQTYILISILLSSKNLIYSVFLLKRRLYYFIHTSYLQNIYNIFRVYDVFGKMLIQVGVFR